MKVNKYKEWRENRLGNIYITIKNIETNRAKLFALRKKIKALKEKKQATYAELNLPKAHTLVAAVTCEKKKTKGRDGCSDITGEWNSSEGVLTLRPAKIAKGGYLGSYGKDNGRLLLRKVGRKLYGKWVEAGSNEKCSTEVDSSYYWGRVEFNILENNSKLEGKWSYCIKPVSRSWTGSRDCGKEEKEKKPVAKKPKETPKDFKGGGRTTLGHMTFHGEEDGTNVSCAAYLAANPEAPDGIYTINPTAPLKQFSVYCDMTTDGGGWTRVVNITRGSVFHADNPNAVGNVSDSTAAAKLSDAAINKLATIGYWRYECGAKKRIFVKNSQNIWTSEKVNSYN